MDTEEQQTRLMICYLDHDLAPFLKEYMDSVKAARELIRRREDLELDIAELRRVAYGNHGNRPTPEEQANNLLAAPFHPSMTHDQFTKNRTALAEALSPQSAFLSDLVKGVTSVQYLVPKERHRVDKREVVRAPLS